MKFDKKVKQSKLKEFQSQLKIKWEMFGSALQQPSDIVKASYSIWFLIARKKMKTFPNDEFVKECLGAIVNDILFDKNNFFSNLSFFRLTVPSNK